MSHYKTLSKPLISNHFLVSIFILIELHFCNLREWITLYPISTVKQTRWIDKVQNYSAMTYRINKSSSTVFSYAWNKDHYQDKDQASSYAALQDIMHPPVRQETGIYEHKLSANKNIYNITLFYVIGLIKLLIIWFDNNTKFIGRREPLYEKWTKE